MGEQNPGKGPLLPFETAYQNLKGVMEGLRASPKADFNHEKTMVKLKDVFTAFSEKKGSPHEEIDDEVDFGDPEEEEPAKTTVPEVKGDAPEYEDMINGPLPGRGLSAGPKYLGKSRLPWATVWDPPAPLSIGLEGKDGFSFQYSFSRGQFTTVTRVVAATEDGKPNVIVSYLLEGLSTKETKMTEPWRSSDARELMFLMKLRVMETPQQVAAFGWTTVQRDVIPPDQDRSHFFPQYVPVREVCTKPEFCVTWVRKVSAFREIPMAIRADPPPLSTVILFGTSTNELVDPYNLYPEWDGEKPSLEEREPQWRFKHCALKRDCALCPGVKCFRLVPCCACEHWVHLECSYGIPEGRLCASHCQILDPLRGVVVTDFQCGPNEVRCLVPWRPWIKKYRKEWWEGKKRMREMHDLLPNVALEKHAHLGAGLIWKRIYGGSTGIRPEQKTAETIPELTPWKALPLIPNWDKEAVPTYHREFNRHAGESVFTALNDLTNLEMDRYNENVSSGMRIRAMDHPYMLSPPSLPVTGATSTPSDTVKVMAFHGITYSHKGLVDPAIMPEYVRLLRENHCAILRYATLDPELPRWAFLWKGYVAQKWDLAGETQAYSRPTGREKAMICNEQTLKWEKAPEPVNLPDPGKGESTEKEAKPDKTVQLKRRSETEGDEPKAKKGGIASEKEKAKPLELKPASEVSKASQDKAEEDAGKAGRPAEERVRSDPMRQGRGSS